MSLLIAILGLAFLILIHEAGHFFVARAVGMRPRKFYVGFPPALAKVVRNGIEYGIGAIPLGGYVKIPGMHRPAPADLDVHFARALHEAPELTGPIERVKRPLADGRLEEAKAALQELAAAIEAGDLSSLARKAAERGVTEIGDALGKDAYWRQRTWKRVLVIFAGPGTNLVFAVGLFAVLFAVGGLRATTAVDTVLPGHPAAKIGLEPGDRIVAIGGRPVTKPGQIPERIVESKGRPLQIVVERDGRRVVLGPVRAQKTDGSYRLGFSLRGRGLSPPEAVWQSIRLTGLLTKETGKALLQLAHGSGRKDISSPVGIVEQSSNALNQSVQNYLSILAFLSLSLALLNLLPLLPLDGGHIAFSIIEGLRGRAVGREVYERVSAIGIALVLLLFFIGLSNDIGGLNGG